MPSFYTVHERQALKAAVEIANMKVLSLIEENTAAALQYGKDHVFDEANHTVLFYNMGASATQVTITTYGAYSGKENGKNKSIGIFEVNAKAWDEHLGGTDFDLVLTELFADEFNAMWGKGDVREVPREQIAAKIVQTLNILKFKMPETEQVLRGQGWGWGWGWGRHPKLTLSPGCWALTTISTNA